MRKWEKKLHGKIIERNSKKWTSLFVPEHLQLLREWVEEDKYTPQPILDEFDLENIQEEIEIGLKRKSEVQIRTWRDGINTT